MSLLTPELLRKAADLIGLHYYDTRPPFYMCHAVMDAAGDECCVVDQFEDLLREHGVSTDGDLDEPGMPQEESQPIRFMFLEFLALSMETN
jgi:hypothetical protein